MSTLKDAAADFLAQKRIAVAGVSRDSKQPANLIFRTLRDAGHEVFAVNPNAHQVEDSPSYHDLKSIPGGVDAVMIATPPGAALKVASECAEIGVSRIWMHRSFGKGSVSEEAVDFCRARGIEVIAGGCPMMFITDADVGHRCMRWVLNLTGALPKEV
jgi:predicted CoA-binding protein